MGMPRLSDLISFAGPLVQEPVELGLVKRGEGVVVVCSFTTMHIDMELRAAA